MKRIELGNGIYLTASASDGFMLHFESLSGVKSGLALSALNKVWAEEFLYETRISMADKAETK